MNDAENITTQTAAFSRLLRLQQQNRANVPAYVTQHATTTFTLHHEPIPAEASDRVLVVVYPQDPFVGEPEVRTMGVHDIQSGLVNSRVKIQDDRGELAKPDRDNNYLFWPDTPQFDQVNSFYYTTFTLRMYERYARRALPWSFPAPRITVNPHFGAQGNAFYSEQDQLLGFHSFELDGKKANTAWSADIISHEAGHAVLDGLRDLYNESFGLGPMAFHESFGDITAVLVALHDDSLVRRLLEWTKGDLKTDNFVAAVAEQLGKLQAPQDYMRGHTYYLRNSINTLKNQPFDTLHYAPSNPITDLGWQNHNYSRLFTGAFYDVLVGIYEQLQADYPAHIAIYNARNIAGYLLLCAVELGPVGEFDFSDLARSFIAADHTLYEGRYRDVLLGVFENRRLLSRDDAESFVKSLSNLPDIRLPEAINSAMASALFLEKTILPALNLNPLSDALIPLAAYRNSAGYAFLTYFSSQQVHLDGDNYGSFSGSNVDVFGGLTLMFDKTGRLCSMMYRPVSDEDVRQIRIIVQELIQRGLLMHNMPTTAFATQEEHPQGVLIPPMQNVRDALRSHLIKFPVIYDRIPPRISDFVEYLNTIRTKLGKPQTSTD